jgi:hypothetical protein
VSLRLNVHLLKYYVSKLRDKWPAKVYVSVIEHQNLLALVDMFVARNVVRSVRFSLNGMDYGVHVVGID